MPSPDPSAELVESPNTEPAPNWLKSGWYGLCLIALGAMLFWGYHLIVEFSAAEQRALAPVSTVWAMHACVLLGFTGFGVLAVSLARWLGRRHLLIGASLAVLAFAASGLAPQSNRIFYDEHIYMQIGQTLAHTGRAEYASYGRIEYGDFTMFDSWVNKQPNGHPYLLSWMYKLAGASEAVSFAGVRLVAALSAAILYFALLLIPLRLPSATPIAATLCLIFTPLVLWWSRTVAVEPTASATATLVFFAACLHARWRNPDTGEGSPLSGLILASAAAFAAYFRPESLLVFPVAACVLWAADRRFLEDRVTWAALALAVALLIPNLMHLWSVRTEDWGATDGRRFDFAFLGKNLDSNLGYFFRGRWYPLAGTLLALCGAGWLAMRSRRFLLGAGVWFLLSWGIFVVFYAGGYYYGASSRYAVVSTVPVALFAGVGAAALLAGLRRWPLAASVIGVAVVMNWVSTMSFVPTLGRESNEARADIDFAREVAAKLPTGSLVISTDPCIWNLLGRNAGQMFSLEKLVRGGMREMVRQYPGGIYLHWDYWVNTQPKHAAIWRQLALDCHATLFARRNAEAVQLAMFRLDTPYAREVLGGDAKIETPPVDLDALLGELANAEPPSKPEEPPAAAVPDPAAAPGP